MIVDPQITNMLKSTSLLLPTASSSVAPVPTVIPGDTPIYQKSGDVGNRTLWYVALASDSCAATDGHIQGRRRHHGSLLVGLLCHGLPCSSRKQ